MAENNSKQDQTPEEEKFNETFSGMLREISELWTETERDILTPELKNNGTIDVQFTFRSYEDFTKKTDQVLENAETSLKKVDKLDKLDEIKKTIESTKSKFFDYISEKSTTRSTDILEAMMANNQKKVKDFLVEDLLTKAIKDSN